MLKEDYVEAIFYDWVDKLHLGNWRIILDLKAETHDPDCFAQVTLGESYKEARVTFRSDWATWTQDRLDDCCVHELLHLILKDFETAACAGEYALGHEARKLFSGRIEHELEQLIDTLTSLILDGMVQ